METRKIRIEQISTDEISENQYDPFYLCSQFLIDTQTK
jgi:hypothetical protein